MGNLIRQTSPVVQVGGDITGTEATPTLVTQGFGLPEECSSVIWDFNGGTSATISFWSWNPELLTWSKDGTQDITGSEVVNQQAAGSRVHATVTTYGGGTYKRTAQVVL